MEFNSKLFDVYKLWEEKVKPHMNKAVHLMFRAGMSHAGKLYDLGQKSKAVNVVQTLINGFNVNTYKKESWGASVGEVYRGLHDLEKLALN